MMGWKIYRIWSTDWIKDIVNEKQRLLKAVESAINSYKPETFDTSTSDNKKKINVEEDLLQFEDKTTTLNDNYGFEKYKVCSLKGRVAEYDARGLAKYIEKVVEIEAPIHFDILCQRVCNVIGRQKVSSVVQNMVRRAINYSDDKIKIKDDFAYQTEKHSANYLREAGSRSIHQIAYDELAMGMLKVIDNNIGLTKEELIHETARAFGFTRIGNNITERMEKVVKLMIKNKLIEIKDDKVIRA